MNSALLRVLILEDSEADALLLVRRLREAGYATKHTRVADGPSIKAALQRDEWDLLLADYSLPGFTAIGALEVLHQLGLDLPVIVVSGVIREEDAAAAYNNGAHDFVTKANLSRLIPAVKRELHQARGRAAHRKSEAARIAAERRLLAHVESATDIMFTLRDDLTIGFVNSAFGRVTGFKDEQILGESLLSFVHPDDADAVQGRFRRTATNELVPPAEVKLLRKQGEYVPVEVSAVPLVENGQVVETMGIARDVTERIRARERDANLIKRLGALRNIDIAITSSLDLRVTLNVLLDEGTARLGADAADVYLLDDATHRLRHAAERGFRTSGPRLELSPTDRVAGEAVSERRRVDAYGDRDFAKFKRAALMKEERFVEYHAVPLNVKGDLKGVLEVFNRSPVVHDADRHDFLEALALQAAIAVDNATLVGNLRRANTELSFAYDGTLEGWAKALELRDYETAGHSKRAVALAVALARELGVSETEIVHVVRGSLLHDIGKLAIPDQVLLKPGPLTDAEREVVKKHPIYAYELLSEIPFLLPSLDIPYCHHEKWDGTGYPRGLRQQQIPLSARIFALVDVWDALGHVRPYKKAWPLDEMLTYFRQQSGTHFDPGLVEPFLRIAVAMRGSAGTRPNNG